MTSSKVISTIFLIVSAVIGAGFASGEEITVFFGAFNFWTLLNVLLFAVFFFICSYFFLAISAKKQLCSILENSKLNRWYHRFSILVLVLMSATMLSMIGKLCSNLVFINPILFKLIFLGVSVSIAFVGSEIFSETNGKIGKNLFIAILIALIYLLFSKSESVGNVASQMSGGFLKTILYVSLNIFLIIELLTKSGERATKKQRFIIAGFSASFLAILILLMSIIIKIKGLKENVGFMFGLMQTSKIFGVAYSIILVVAAFTSLVTGLNAIKEKSDRVFKQKNKKLILIMLLVVIFGISFFDFSSMIKYLYPVEAILCLVYIGCLLCLQLFRNPFFKCTYSKIHKRSKNAKNKSACHN